MWQEETNSNRTHYEKFQIYKLGCIRNWPEAALFLALGGLSLWADYYSKHGSGREEQGRAKIKVRTRVRTWERTFLKGAVLWKNISGASPKPPNIAIIS